MLNYIENNTPVYKQKQAACNKVLEKLSDNSIQLQAMKSELELMNTQTDISICLKKPIAESARAKQSTRTKQYLNKSIKHVEKRVPKTMQSRMIKPKAVLKHNSLKTV